MASYVLMLAVLSFTGLYLDLAWPYHAGLAIAGAMMLYHWFLIRDRSREGCFKAFRHNNWVGVAIFAGIVASTPRLPWQ
jgi:4-hydroxybenzoate polyprenyltransferase